MSWYVVHRGRIPGVYNSWRKCQEQVNGYRNNSYQKFNTMEEAEEDYLQFLAEQDGGNHGVALNHGVATSSRTRAIIILVLLLLIVYLLYLFV